MPLLSLIVFIPAIGCVLLMLIPGRHVLAVRAVALLTALVDLALAVVMVMGFNPAAFQMQFVERVSWVPSLGINYSLGVDGISVLLVVLTTLIGAVAILASWRPIEHRVKEYMICFLLMQVGVLGVFCALDFLAFFVFWELMLVPMYLIIGIWGSPGTATLDDRRRRPLLSALLGNRDKKLYSTVKFFIYTTTGSLLMLAAFVALYIEHARVTGVPTLDIVELANARYGFDFQLWVFIAFAIAFAIKVPMWPLHTWLPDAHVDAPTAGSVVLAGVLLKMGSYGFLRFSLPMLPDATRAAVPVMLVLATIAILYGALVAWQQTDFKKLIAYSSVAHMGFIMVGIFALNQQGVEGAIIQMFNHGTTTGALFLIVGMLYERLHHREIARMGGFGSLMPVYASIFGVFMLASVGLPGLSGFVGEFLVLLGSFTASVPIGVFSTAGIILAAAYTLWMYQRVIFQEPRDEKDREHYAHHIHDITKLEVATLLPLLLFVIWIGVYPQPFFTMMHASVEHLLQNPALALAR